MAVSPSLELLVLVLSVGLSCCVCAPLPLHWKEGKQIKSLGNTADIKEPNVDHVDHDHTECGVLGYDLAQGFNELANEMSITGPDGVVCYHHVNSWQTVIQDIDTELASNLTCSVMYEFVNGLLVKLNLTTECCLVNDTACGHHHHGQQNGTNLTEVYGYGFLMIIFVSACPLLGVVVVPFVKKNSRFGRFYKYLYSLMIALGASALLSDAVLHLIPEAFGLHGHGHEPSDGDYDDHVDEEEDKSFLWKGCVVIGGTYFFFLFEIILHSWNSHQHSHGVDGVLEHPHSDQESGAPATSSLLPNRSRGPASQSNRQYGSTDQQEKPVQLHNESDQQLEPDSPTNPLIKGAQERFKGESNFTDVSSSEDSDECLEPTFPHGKCRDTRGGTPGIIHPGIKEEGQNTTQLTSESVQTLNCCVRVLQYLHNVKPLAWLIIFGDAIHNFADGLALGAAISQSLSLGLSTMIALMFHEIPHELGDFVILLSTGMRWYMALLFNVLSQVTAIIGFFVGVAVSTNSEDANVWILAVTAGVFLYIALVDLLPGLIHTKEKGCTRWGLFIMTNTGFILAFGALLTLAMFEEELNSLIP